MNVNKYIGLPYLDKGRTEAGVDCWGLAKLVYKNEFDIDIPSYSEEYTNDNIPSITESIARYKETWVETKTPKPGSLVLMRVMGAEMHVGVYIGDNKFIHSRENADVVVERVDSTAWAKRVVGYFDYKEKSAGALVTAVPHPLRTERLTVPVPAGTTVKQISTWVLKEYAVDPSLTSRVVILVNGEVVPQDKYDKVLADNDIVEYRALPGKSVLRLVLLVVVAVYAPYLANYMVGTGWGAIAAGAMTPALAVATAAITMVGGLLVNAIFPIRPPSMPQPNDPGSAERQNMLTGGQNQANKYGAVPVVLGKVRMNGVLGAKSFLESADEDSYLNLMLVWGFGPLRVSDLHIGATEIDQYQNSKSEPVQYVHLNDTLANDEWTDIAKARSIYSGDLEQNYHGVKLVNNATDGNPWIESTLVEPDINKISVSYHFPEGLRTLTVKGDSAGAISAKECRLELQYAPLDINGDLASDWRDPHTISKAQVAIDLASAAYVTSTLVDNGDYYRYENITTNYYRWTRIGLDSAGNYVTKVGAYCATPYGTGIPDTTSSWLGRYSYGGPNLNTTKERLPAWSADIIPLYDVCVYGHSTQYAVSTSARRTDYSYVGFEELPKPSSTFMAIAYAGVIRLLGPNEQVVDYVLSYTRFIVAQGVVSKDSTVFSYGINNYVKRKDAFTATKTIFVPANPYGYQIRTRRINSDITEPNDTYRYMHTVHLHTVTGYTNREPILDYPNNTNPDFRITRTAMRIKSNDQLNGQLEGVNAYVETICLIWNRNTQEWIYGTTNNPAALFRYVLQHVANAQRISASDVNARINLTALQDWYEYCEDNNFAYNGIVSAQRSILEVLRDVAAAGRASPTIVDGKWTVIIDRPRLDIVQHFTPHNSWGFESVKALPRLPDGLKCTFNNEEKGFQEEEVIIYAAGKNETNSEIFEQISLPGVTNAGLAQLHTRWHFAQAKLRPEIYTINTDLEYLVCNRGDRVKVMHDVPMWGISSGRITERLSSTKFKSDEPLPLDDTTNYLIRVRDSIGRSKESNIRKTFNITQSSRSGNKVTVYVDEHNLEPGHFISTSITSGPSVSTANSEVLSTTETSITYAAIGTSYALTSTVGTLSIKDGYYNYFCTNTSFDLVSNTLEADIHDLFMLGTVETQFNDLVVLSVEPFGNTNAKITLNDYSEQIYTDNYLATNFTISDFNTAVTEAPKLLVNSILVSPNITNIISDETVLEVISPGVFRSNLKVMYTNPKNLPTKVQSVEIQIDYAEDTVDNWLSSGILPLSAYTVTFKDVIEGDQYKIRARYISLDGRTGPWSAELLHTIVGKTNPPGEVTGTTFSIIPSSGTTNITWASNPELDLKGYEIRELDQGWGTEGYLFRGNTTTWAVDVLEESKTFYIKAYDTGNRYSLLSTPINVTKALPEAVSHVSAEFSGNTTSTTGSTVTFSWPTAVSLAVVVKYYKITLTKPGLPTITSEVYGNTWTTNADWLGTAVFTITTYDMLDRASVASYTLNVSKLVPNAPLTYTIVPTATQLEIDWTDSIKTTLPIAGYEIRKNDTDWGTKDENWVWKGNVSKATVTPVSGLNTLYVNAYDTDGRYATSGLAVAYTVTPPGTVTNLQSTYATAISGSTLTLTWAGNKNTFNIDHYIITLDKPNGYPDITATVSANTWTTAADWLGTCTVTVTPVDKAGFAGPPTSLFIEKNKPDQVLDTEVSVVGLNLYFNWGDLPRSGGGMPVAGYEIRSTSSGFGTAGAVWRGAVSEATISTFITGVNDWYIAAYDTDGKYGDPVLVSYTVRVPNPVTGLTASFADTNSTGAQFAASWVPPVTVYFSIDYYDVTLTKPDASVYKVNTKATSINIPVDWTGGAIVTVKVIDITGRVSNTASFNLTKLPPSAPTTYSVESSSGGMVLLSWNKAVATSLPLEGYEVRSHGTTPGTDDHYWRGNALSASIAGPVLGLNEWDIYSYDTDLGYSTTPLHVHYTVVAPPTPIDFGYTFATGATGASVRLNWSPGPHTVVADTIQFPIKHYEVSLAYTQPFASTITALRNTTDWEINTLWEGSATITVAAVDILGNTSAVLTSNLVKQAPNPPSSVIPTEDVGSVFFDWPDPVKTSLPVVGYELRNTDSDWGSAGYKWKGTVSQYTLSLSSEVSNGDTFPKTLTKYLRSYDSSGTYSNSSAPVTLIVDRPPTTVIGDADFADTSLTSATFSISWAQVTPVYGLKHYKVVFNGKTVYSNTNSITMDANWIGDQPLSVYTVDYNNIESTPATKILTKLAPNPAENFRAQVIDNNVLLYWTLPARTTLPISHVLLKKGEDWNTATVIGNKDGTFTSISELTGSTYRYWIAIVDTDDNISTPVSIVTTVSQPPDFIFNAEYVSDFTGTLVNAKVNEQGALVLPVNLTEQFDQHFSTRSWSSPQSQVTAGYPIYIQPGVTSGYYEDVYDYGTALGSSQITVSLDSIVLAGSPTVTTTISTSIDGTNYTDFAGTLSIFATNFRFVKVRVDVVQNAVGDLYQINGMVTRLDAKQLSDSGQVLVSASGSIANFNKEIIDVTAITVSPVSSLARVAVYDFNDTVETGTYSLTSNLATITQTAHGLEFGQKVRLFFTSGTAKSGVYTVTSVPNANQFIVSITNANTSGNVTTYPNSMKIYLFDTSGTSVSGTVSWSLRGY